MKTPVSRLRLQSWIPPAFVWTAAAGIFCLRVSSNDSDVVDFISTGNRQVVAQGTRKSARLLSVLVGGEALSEQLKEAVWIPAKLKPEGHRVKAGTKVIAHCHGVFLLPDEKILGVLVGRAAPRSPSAWISDALKAEADAVLQEYSDKVTELKEEIERKMKEDEEFHSRNSELEKFKGLRDFLVAQMNSKHPVLTAERLLPLLPRATTFLLPPSMDFKKIERAAVAAIAGSNWAPSRDGVYLGVLPMSAGRRTKGFVSWTPHDGLPSYPEVRWIVQRRLPSALLKPRIQKAGRPEFDRDTQSANDPVLVPGLKPDPSEVYEALKEIQLDLEDFDKRVDDIRKDTKSHGFEAIAWFQPYHVWTEETWGIHIDARKLDSLACSFLDDFRSNRIRGSHSLAAMLALGLVYSHEQFHADVEAALSWLEITSLRPRHLRYKRGVYDQLRETPDWLEEALANWSAWAWFQAPATQALITHIVPSTQSLERIVKTSLSLSPPGYREWRLGDQTATWRTFATQLLTANPKLTSPGIGLPVESTLTGPVPYDLQPSDVPLRFLGQGVIADRLRTHPATFNVPTRRELEKALKYFKHILDTSGGKGGHQKWTGPDQRAFILPTRDPVSPGVFKTFLHYMGIDKATYVYKIRPNL